MRRKILIIDDEPAFLDYVREVVQEFNYEIITATNGEDGIQRAQESLPDLIILDLAMPGIPGGVVLSRLKKGKSTCDIPVIFITGVLSKLDEEMTGGKIAGELLLTKPFEKDKLYAMIERALNKKP